MQQTDFAIPWRGLVLRGSTVQAGAHAAPAAPVAPQVLALHGGGLSTTHRGIDDLRGGLAARGISTAAFDFSGHGASTGALAASSLRHRADQALAVAQALDLRAPRALLATSMGAHVACSLIEALAPSALVLFAPAAYAGAAETVPFGPAFQQVLRATATFADSPAFAALEGFTGRLLVVYGTEDAVIPPAVQHGYRTRAVRAASVDVVSLPGAGHRLHDWLRMHPAERDAVLRRVAATILPPIA